MVVAVVVAGPVVVDVVVAVVVVVAVENIKDKNIIKITAYVWDLWACQQNSTH